MTAVQTATRDRASDLVRNVSMLGILWFAYSQVRSLTANDLAVAMENAAHIRAFEAAVGLPSELHLQALLLESRVLMKALNFYYIAAHFPVTFALLGWVWLKHRAEFDRVRNVLVTVTGIGLGLHVLYPLAPPRMISGFVDTGAVFGPDPYEMGIAGAANQIAAMPSLHVGWALLVAIGVIWILSTPWRWAALLHPAITVGVVVLTANHYWIDAIVAIALVLAGWKLFAPLVERHELEQAPEPSRVLVESR